MARKKPRLVQITMFQEGIGNGEKFIYPEAEIMADVYWQQFLPAVHKLHDERRTGKNTTGGYSCPDWWRSRFSDFLTNNNSQPKDHEEWKWRRIGYDAWQFIWKAHEAELTIIKP